MSESLTIQPFPHNGYFHIHATRNGETVIPSWEYGKNDLSIGISPGDQVLVMTTEETRLFRYTAGRPTVRWGDGEKYG